MKTNCEVIGWLVDTKETQVLVREDNGHISQQRANSQSAFGRQAIQTGRFRRGNIIVDPVTLETVGYEMERVSTPIDALAV